MTPDKERTWGCFFMEIREVGGDTLTHCKSELPALEGLESHPTAARNLQEIWQEPCHEVPERIAWRENVLGFLCLLQGL